MPIKPDFLNTNQIGGATMPHRFFAFVKSLRCNGLRAGFTMIEILIVVSLIAIMAVAIVPAFVKRDPALEWPAVVQEINNMVDCARQQAIAKQKTHRVVFVSRPAELDQVLLEVEYRDPEKPNKILFKQLEVDYFKSKYELPRLIKIKSVFQNGIDQLQESVNKHRAFCHIINEGLVEDALVHLVRTSDDKAIPEIVVSLKMLPFFGRFDYFPMLIKPEK